MSVQVYRKSGGKLVCYLAVYRGPDGARLAEKVATVPAEAPAKRHQAARTKAELHALERRAQVESGTWQPKEEARPRPAERLTVRAAVAKFLGGYRTASGSMRFLEQRLRVLDRHLGDLLLVKVTPEHLERFRNDRLLEASASTVCKELVVASTLFTWLEARGYCSSNPASAKLVRRPKVTRREPYFLTHDEEARLLAECAPWLSRCVRFMLATGSEPKEVAALSWSDVKAERQVVELTRAKTGTRRDVPIAGDVAGVLEECRRGRTVHGAGRVFLNAGGEPLTTVGLKSGLEKAYRRAGISKPPARSLRHAFATRLLAAGVDPVTISELLGHSNLDLLKVYAHAGDGAKKAALEKLAETTRRTTSDSDEPRKAASE